MASLQWLLIGTMSRADATRNNESRSRSFPYPAIQQGYINYLYSWFAQWLPGTSTSSPTSTIPAGLGHEPAPHKGHGQVLDAVNIPAVHSPPECID